VYDAKQRVEQIKKAHQEGNEIAAHAVGHFDGTTWSHQEWSNELSQFDSILAYRGLDRKNIIRGFRAPELGQNEDLQKVLQEFGYKYDTSKVGLAQSTPYKKNGLWELPVASIDYAPYGTPGLSMDYSIYAHQTGAIDTVVRGTAEWQKLYVDTMQTYKNYFYSNYEGNHAPVYIAHHFSKWNDGVYYEVMKDLAREICGKKNVECVTYRELYRKLNTYQ
jgi:peptidoglycan/xylan/chitin deacetylase (PgdA/CDA1 family)